MSQTNAARTPRPAPSRAAAPEITPQPAPARKPERAKVPDSPLFPADIESHAPIVFVVRASYVAGALAGIASLLLLASLAGMILYHGFGHKQVFGLIRLFDLDDEANIPTFFQASLLLASAGLAWTIGRIHRRQRQPRAGQWSFIACILLLLACDEAAQIHELLIDPLRAALHTGGALYFAWVIVGAAMVAVVGLLNIRFLLALPRRTRWQLLLAAGLYVGGALGMEMLDGWYLSTHGNNMTYAFLTHIEESLEMAGQITAIYALLGYLADLRLPVSADLQRS